MAVIWKHAFAKELKISPVKLDSLMKELDLQYESTPRDKKMLVVSDDTQKSIKTYLDTGEKPEKEKKK